MISADCVSKRSVILGCRSPCFAYPQPESAELRHLSSVRGNSTRALLPDDAVAASRNFELPISLMEVRRRN